jgi:hypothetical protein
MPASRLFLGYREDARATSMTPVLSTANAEHWPSSPAPACICGQTQSCNASSQFAPHSRSPIGAGHESKGMGMTEQPYDAAQEREEIAARVASFKATQEKFEREREEYFVTTLENARSGSERLPSWS